MAWLADCRRTVQIPRGLLSTFASLFAAIVTFPNDRSAVVTFHPSTVIAGSSPCKSAVAASTLVAALLAYPVRKLRGIFLAIATVGFGEIVRVIVNNVNITGGAEPVDLARTLASHGVATLPPGSSAGSASSATTRAWRSGSTSPATGSTSPTPLHDLGRWRADTAPYLPRS